MLDDERFALPGDEGGLENRGLESGLDTGGLEGRIGGASEGLREGPLGPFTLSMSSITRASISRRASGGGGMAPQRMVTLFSLFASTSAARTSAVASVLAKR